MRRTTPLTVALAAGLIAPTAAFGQAGTLGAIQPVTGNIEVVGQGSDGSALVLVSFGAVSAAQAAADGLIQLQYYKNDNTTNGPAVNILAADLTEIVDAGTAGSIETGDIWQIDLSNALPFAPSGTFAFDVILKDPAGDDSLTINVDGFPGLGDDSDTNDTLFQVNTVRPTFSSAFIHDTDGMNGDDTLFLVGNFNGVGPTGAVSNSLFFAPNAGQNNPNNTTQASINNLDFEFSTDNFVTPNQFTADDVASVGAIAAGQTFIQLGLTEGMTNLAIGTKVRVDTGTGDVTDATGQLFDGTVTIQDFVAITITGASWKQTVPVGGAPVADALSVSFSLPVSSAGDVAFWNGLALSGGGMTDLVVTAVQIDPNNNQNVLLTVDSNTADGVAADGKGLGGADNMSFEVSVDDMVGTPPNDLFGNAYTGTQTQAITDMIVPATVGAPFTLDEDGDGSIDAFGQYFSEPLDSSMTAAAGFTLARLTSTIHPFSTFMTNLAADPSITNPNDMANQVAITAAGDMTDEFPATTFGLSSQDTSGMNRLQQNNSLIVRFDSPAFDWDDDAMTTVTPGTLDAGFASVAITAATSGVKDANANALGADVAAANVTDGAGPVAVRTDFSTGDNLSAGMQKPSEQDGAAGDSPLNNTAFVTFNEGLNAGGIDETKFRFGVTSTERFAAGDSGGLSGAGNNILSLTDSSGGGFGPGDTFTIAALNGVTDAAANAYPGTSGTAAPALTVQDVTAPYVVLQQDINGATIHSAFLGGIDPNGFATTLTLTFSTPIKAGTAGAAGDWSIEGVPDPVSAPVLSGNRLTFTFPTGFVAADNVITVTYNGATAATLITANGGSMGKVAAMNDTFSARKVPEPNVDGEFISSMDIAGTITGTDGSTPVPAGTKAFGMIAAPRASGATFTMGGVTATVTDTASLQAITNVMLGIETNLYLLVDNQEMFFANYKDRDGFQEGIINIKLSATTLSKVTFTGSGSTTVEAGGPITTNLSVTNGTVEVCWDVLRSSDGTAFNLFNNGFALGGQPIVSSAVVTGDDGKYFLHMTAPLGAFNGALNAMGWPVIMVIELPTGERIAVSSMLNAADGIGAITFQGLNRQSDPFNSDANIVFNPNLQNCAVQNLFGGWNTLPFDRDSGFQVKANSVLLPGGVTKVITGTDLENTNPLDQFVYFLDTNNDGVWTSADDSASRLDGVAASSGCLDLLAFVMNSNGVKIGDDIDSFTGGYAAGVFNGVATGGGAPQRVGVFQFGPMISASTVFAATSGTGSFPNTTTTLGWALVTSPTTSTSLATFLGDNGSDFLILFNRTSNSAVDIRSFSSATGTAGAPEDDAAGVNQGGALFLHKSP